MDVDDSPLDIKTYARAYPGLHRQDVAVHPRRLPLVVAAQAPPER